MKRFLSTLVAAMFVAAGAQAGTITISLDQNVYTVGDTITMTAVLDVVNNVDLATNLASYGIQLGWDPTKASVANGTPGTSTQSGLLTGPSGSFSASLTPACAVSGDRCTTITQTWIGGTGFVPGPQQIIGTLVLTANAPGLLGEAITAYSNIAGFSSDTNPANVVLGANWGGATIVPIPEPGTLLLLGAGLGGLTIMGRRERS